MKIENINEIQSLIYERDYLKQALSALNGKEVNIIGLYRASDGATIREGSNITQKIYVQNVDKLIVMLEDGTKVYANKKNS